MAAPPANARQLGPLVASALIVCWAVHTAFWVSRPAGSFSLWLALPAVYLQSLLYMGLFITAHDAMHGLAAPGRPRLNRALGQLAVLLYAFFPYEQLRAAHLDHHAYPAEPGRDPDFHDGVHRSVFAWYAKFVRQYLSLWQFLALMGLFHALRLLGFYWPYLVAFWVLPSLVSSVQLFVVGTYLPHREPHDASQPIRSLDLPQWLSLLACYHFGYHSEHHAEPWQPWWALPATRRRLQSDASAPAGTQ